MKKYLFLSLRIIAFIIIVLLVQTLCVLPLYALVDNDGMAYWFVDKLTFTLGVVVATIFLLENWKIAIGLSWKGRGVDVLAGMAMALSLYAVGFFLSWVLGAIEVVDVQVDFKGLLLSWLLMLLVALSEEIALRSFVLGSMLHVGMNRFVALILSSLLFSLLHLFNPNFTFLPFLNIFLAGLLLGASYIYTRNLWFPISLHLFWNWIQGLLGFQVSGNAFGASLITLRLPEDNLINGGEFGFEGSLLCTLLCLIATGLIIRYYERKRIAFL